MSAIFTPRANAVARAVIGAALVIAAAVPLAAMVWVRTPLARGEHRAVVQPVAFDHRVHATGLAISCTFCHSGADRSANAGIPATTQCMGCHTDTWIASAAFLPVRESLAHGTPIKWRRVTHLPDYVYFNHAAHVNKHVSCQTCHGNVQAMPVVQQEKSLTMSWCVDCHRTAPQTLHARALTNCSTCHR